MSTPTWRWATVTQIDPLRIRLDGEANPLPITPDSLTSDLFPGDRVWVQYYGRDLIVTGSAAQYQRASYLENAKRLMTGGGLRIAKDANSINWSQRFLAGMNAGRGPLTALSGYFNIEQPPVDTVIPVIGSSSQTTSTVTANGVQLINWQTLWYDPPITHGEVSDPARFYITSYTASFDVPETWIPLVSKNGDTGTFFWMDGKETAPWLTPALNSPWLAYGSGYMPPRYKRENGIVYIQGLVKASPTTTTGTIFTLPAGYRPNGGNRLTITHASGGVSDLRVNTSGAVTVYAYIAGGNGADVSLEVPPFPADQ